MSKEDLQPAQKGEVRNPKGKPKGTKNWKTIINEIVNVQIDNKDENVFVKGKKITPQQIIIIQQVQKAMKGDTKSAEVLMNRMDGYPKEDIKIDANVKTDLTIIGVNADTDTSKDITSTSKD